MATGIRDWTIHGVTLKVELATSGGLVAGTNQTDFPWALGGEYGAPYGWDAGEYFGGNAGNESAYNFTTDTTNATFSVSTKAVATRSAGIWQVGTFPMEVGYRYQIGCQARIMAGKASTTNRSVTIERSTNGGASFSYYTGSQSVQAQNDWEDILAMGSVISTPNSIGRINILGGNMTGQPAALWGAQFRGLYIRKADIQPPNITWEDITCDVQGMTIRYGRERYTNRYDVATMQLDLVNTDGKYSYHNPHPLNLAPGRQVRITATHKGITYPMAFHVLDSITDAMSMDGLVISRWQCVDPTTTLSNQTVSTAQAPQLNAPKRVGLLLDQVGYIPRVLDAGANWYMQPVVGSGRSIRDECGLTADSEGGNFFADRSGNCVYKDRNWLTSDVNLQQVTADLVAFPHAGGALPIVDAVPTQAGAPLICVNEYQTDWSLARVVNLVSLANAGGTAHEYVDEDSLKQYGPATYQRHDFVLNSDYYLDQRAQDLMSGYSDPVVRVNSIAFAPGLSNAWPWVLNGFLNWLVRIWYTHPTKFWGYAVCVHVQSIEHRISLHDWETRMSVDLARSFVELEWASEFGWDGGLWDEALWDQGSEKAGALWDEGYNWDRPTTRWGI